MIKTIKIKLIFTIAVCGMVIASSALADGNVAVEVWNGTAFEPLDSQALFSEANILPGEGAERLIRVANSDSDGRIAAVQADSVSDPAGLSQWLWLTIREDALILYQDRLSDFFAAGEVELSEIAGLSSGQYQFEAEFSFDAPNQSGSHVYQGASLSFNVHIGLLEEESIGGEAEGTAGGSGSTGGGGGYSFHDLIISNENISELGSDYAVIAWNTNHSATSRAIYDIVSHADISGQEPPNYGYAFSTAEDANKVTGHSVTVSGLIPGTQYYFRPISKASPEKYGKELVFTTGIGQAGDANQQAPELIVHKTAAAGFTNPGDTIEYEITVANRGLEAARQLTVSDRLPDGFNFSSTPEAKKIWNFTNLEPGDYKSIKYLALISEDIAAGRYSNTAAVFAQNHNLVMATTTVEVRNVKVLGESLELEPTGFDIAEFMIIILAILFLILLSAYFRTYLTADLTD